MTRWRRAGGFGAVSAVLASLVWAPSAVAITPPSIVNVPLPPDSVGPEQPMRPSRTCPQTPGVLEGTNFSDPPAAWRLLNLDATRAIATGAGVTVAVIDTGVTPNPRLPNVRPGGDYLEDGGDGLIDCDAHGTLVAGIIGAAPAPGDSFAGVAPDATLLSIRQSSEYFELANPTGDGDPNASRAAVDLRAMARAVVHAVNLGAQVINISAVACTKAVRPVDDAGLGAALHWAVAERNVVVVAAAGNTGGQDGCTQNPPPPGNDPASWDAVTTVASPAWWSPDVLTVGSVNDDGVPSTFTLTGPWLGVAAPGEAITSVGNYPDGHLVNGLPGQDGPLVPIYGTSYAAPYVAGLAALLRQKFPQLTAYQVMDRIKATAHAGTGASDPAVGAGVIDPLAALTWHVPDPAPQEPVDTIITPAPPPPPPDERPNRVAAWMLGGFALAAIAAIAAVAGLRGRKQP